MNFPRQIVRKVGIVLAALAALGALSTVGMMSKAETRPSRVSIAVEPHGSVLAVMSATVNSLPLFEWSLRGRTETRGPDYPGPDAATLAVELMWYDIPADRYYQHAFQLDARDLSTFGCRIETTGDHVAGERVWLRLSGGLPVAATVVWAAGGLAGCRFDDPLPRELVRALALGLDGDGGTAPAA